MLLPKALIKSGLLAIYCRASKSVRVVGDVDVVDVEVDSLVAESLVLDSLVVDSLVELELAE